MAHKEAKPDSRIWTTGQESMLAVPKPEEGQLQAASQGSQQVLSLIEDLKAAEQARKTGVAID